MQKSVQRSSWPDLLQAEAGACGGDQGIILLPTFIVGEALRAGQLVSLLPKWDKGEVGQGRGGRYAVYPHRRFVSAKVRCFIEFVQARYLAPLRWDTPA